MVRLLPIPLLPLTMSTLKSLPKSLIPLRVTMLISMITEEGEATIAATIMEVCLFFNGADESI